MLALTRKTDYALVALVHLARNESELSTARGIAVRYGVPLSVLMNILKLLTKAGFVESVRGMHGGYRLSIPPDLLTLKKLVNTLEGPVRLLNCIDEAGNDQGECDLAGCCPVRGPAMRIHRRFDRFLEEVTLAELADECRGTTAESSLTLVEINR